MKSSALMLRLRLRGWGKVYALEIGEVLGCKSEARCVRGGRERAEGSEGRKVSRGRNVPLP